MGGSTDSGRVRAARGRQTLPARARVLTRADFRAARRAGRRVVTRRFRVYLREGAADRARLGLAVSARAGNAVTRNRIKRIVREVFRKRRAWLREVDVVVEVVKPVGRDLAFDDVAAEIDPVLDRLAR